MEKRQSNYELMRIVSMIFIILYHIIIHGNVLKYTTGGLHFIFSLIICITLVHVNSFVLVTGYFNYNKDFKWKKFFSLFVQAWFYQVIIVLIMQVLGFYDNLGSYSLINALSPLNYSYWFIVAYLLLYLLSPYLNKLILNLSQSQHKRLIILLFILFSIIPFITRQVLVKNNGYTFVQFIFMYFIGAYFKKYPINENYHFKRFSKNKLQLLLFGGMIFFCLAHFLMNLLSGYFLNYDNFFFHDFGLILNDSFIYYSAPFVVIQSVCYFLWFGTLSLKSKGVNFVASLVFGIYLIHDNDFVRPFLYKWLQIDNGQMISGYMIIFKVFIALTVIFVICLMIEFIRKKLFEFVGNRKFVQKLSFKIKNYLHDI